MEYIVSFPNERLRPIDIPFRVEMAGTTYPDKNYRISREKSELFCMEYVIQGFGNVTVGNTSFTVSKGEVYILPLGMKQSYYSIPEEPYEKIWFNINGDLCNELIHIYNLEGIYHIKDVPSMYEYFKKFLELCECKELTTNEIFQECALLYHKIVIELSNKVNIKYKDQTIEYKVKEYIHRNIYDTITSDMIEREANLSYSQITRLFKRKYDMTPHNYILHHKIETAKALVLNTNLSIKEIAYKLNFADEHYFSNVFKKYVGVSPSKYSKNCQ